MSDDNNVIPFVRPAGPELVHDPDCDECPDLYERADVDLEDLAYAAKRFMVRFLENFDWTQGDAFKSAAELMFTETDAATVVRLMKNARIEVTVGVGDL